MNIPENEIDAGAEALRQRLQGMKKLNPWDRLPNSAKKEMAGLCNLRFDCGKESAIRMTLTDLASRVERLTGPCRETDREILFAIFPEDRKAIFDGVKHISTMTGRDGEPWFNPLADRTDCPFYTEDLNDAMALTTRWRSIRFEKLATRSAVLWTASIPTQQRQS